MRDLTKRSQYDVFEIDHTIPNSVPGRNPIFWESGKAS